MLSYLGFPSTAIDTRYEPTGRGVESPLRSNDRVGRVPADAAGRTDAAGPTDGSAVTGAWVTGGRLDTTAVGADDVDGVAGQAVSRTGVAAIEASRTSFIVMGPPGGADPSAAETAGTMPSADDGPPRPGTQRDDGGISSSRCGVHPRGRRPCRTRSAPRGTAR